MTWEPLIGQAYLDAVNAWMKADEPACWSWPAPEPGAYATDAQALRALKEWQNDRCAMCDNLDRDFGKRLLVDHRHASGLVRGLLCQPCNTSEGRSDRPMILKYRERNPASILGIRVRYFDEWSRTYPSPTTW